MTFLLFSSAILIACTWITNINGAEISSPLLLPGFEDVKFNPDP